MSCIYKTNKSHHDHHQTLLFLLGYWFVTPLLVSMLVGQLLLVPPGGLCSPKVVLKWPGGNWPIICNVRHSQKTLLEWIVEYSRMLIQWQWRYQSLLLSKCSMLWTQDRVPHENLILFRKIFIVLYVSMSIVSSIKHKISFWKSIPFGHAPMEKYVARWRHHSFIRTPSYDYACWTNANDFQYLFPQCRWMEDGYEVVITRYFDR